MDASRKNKVAIYIASIQAQKKARGADRGVKKRKEVKVALSKRRGIVIKSSNIGQGVTSVAPKPYTTIVVAAPSLALNLVEKKTTSL